MKFVSNAQSTNDDDRQWTVSAAAWLAILAAAFAAGDFAYHAKAAWGLAALPTALAAGALVAILLQLARLHRRGSLADDTGLRIWSIGLWVYLAFMLIAAAAPPQQAAIWAGSDQKVPFLLPGPDDSSWSQGLVKELTVTPGWTGGALLSLSLLESHDLHPPRLSVTAGKCQVGFIDVKPGGGNPRELWWKAGVRSEYSVMIPYGCLASGKDAVTIRPVEGSWIVTQGVRLWRLAGPWEPWRHALAPWNWLLFWLAAAAMAAHQAAWAAPFLGRRKVAMHVGMWIFSGLSLLTLLALLAVVVELKSPWIAALEGNAHSRDMYYSHKYIHDPDLGWRLLPSHVVKTLRPRGDEPEVYYINTREGFRSLKGEAEFPPKGKAMALGDSFVQGMYLTQENAMPAIMADRLGGYVYNLGVVGFSTDQEYTTMMKWIDKVDVEWVVLFFFPNDVLFVAGEEGHGFEKPWYELRDGRVDFSAFHPLSPEFVERENEKVYQHWEPESVYCCYTPRKIWLAPRVMDRIWRYTSNIYYPGEIFSIIAADIKLTKLETINPGPVFPEHIEGPEKLAPSFDIVFDFIGRMNAEVKKRNKNFLVVFLPDMLEVNYPDLPERRNFRRYFLDRCANNDLPCLDTTPELLRKNRVNAVFYVDDGHLSPYGARIAAELTSDHILGAK